jgi:multicomponent Na+:H+ antiporter subunit D
VAHIAALPIAVPLLTAAALVILSPLTGRLADDALALTAAVATTVLCAILLTRVQHGPIVYWFGGWKPNHGVALGISLTIDQLGAGMATLIGSLVIAALVYSWRYFHAIDGLFHALMLVFLAAMVGFCLTGDLFNLFVFFELMSVAAYALSAYRIEERGPIQGAINFAISNSLAAFMILAGIALLYARTGALNLAQIGASLAGHRVDALVVVALVLILLGFLTKAAVVPLHFWLADAHAVAPIPICVLFSGVMVELGVYAVARVYWTAFAAPLDPHVPDLRVILVVLGVVTALVGAVMCFLQRHLKRLLAFSTVGHVGLFVIGVALLSDHGLAGVATYVLGHGLLKAALFMLSGVLLARFATIDEHDLHGRGRGEWATGALWAIGGLALAAVPPVTPFFGKALLEDAAHKARYGWLPVVFLVVSMLTGGAVLRAGGRVFAGLGPKRAPDEYGQEREAREEEMVIELRERTPWLMVGVPGVLLAGALVLGLVPGLVPSIEGGAGHLHDHAAYLRSVLHGAPAGYAPVNTSHLKLGDYLYGAGATVGALGLAAVALLGEGLAERLPRAARRAVLAPLEALRTAHSGHVGDYVAWFTAGLAVVGATCLVVLA